MGIGLKAFTYVVYHFGDVVAAVKTTAEKIFLSADADDFEDFLSSDSFDKLLHYVVRTKNTIANVVFIFEKLTSFIFAAYLKTKLKKLVQMYVKHQKNTKNQEVQVEQANL